MPFTSGTRRLSWNSFFRPTDGPMPDDTSGVKFVDTILTAYHGHVISSIVDMIEAAQMTVDPQHTFDTVTRFGSPAKVTAPWTAEQVAGLNEFQACGLVHPFTCGNVHDGKRDLVATEDGWNCPTCTYTQRWAWKFMTKGAPPVCSVEGR